MSAPARPPAFTYRKQQLHVDELSLSALAKEYGTPLYVYSASAIRERYAAFSSAFRNTPSTICYSVKANSNLSILRMLHRLGAGFDVVSGGELERVLRVSRAAAKKVVFSGVGKSAHEIDAALKANILIFNVESVSELATLAERATRLKKKARMALRVNPDVFADTHPYISTGMREHKFGVAIHEARAIYNLAARNKYLEVAGVSVHIGSQITAIEPFAAAMQRVAELIRLLASDGHRIRFVDAGGGLGIAYKNEDLAHYDFPAKLRDYAQALTTALAGLKAHLLLEPGRSIIGPCGALLSRVVVVKSNGKKRFVIVDAAMNDLIRPTLYSAFHEILPMRPTSDRKPEVVDVVGPVCESGDFFARDRKLPALTEGDLVAIMDVGAYGMSLASNYNTRPRPAEILVDGKKAAIIRKREKVSDLYKLEL